LALALRLSESCWARAGAGLEHRRQQQSGIQWWPRIV
jgi:hypothetical protein